MEEQEERGMQSQRAVLPQVMMMMSIVLFQNICYVKAQAQ
jgi:hypothetical protein